MNYTPHAPKAEWHLTYKCTLACPGCNRGCFAPPATPDMSLEDAREFCRQAAAMNWRPRIIIIGGEPTLHPDFFEFLEIAASHSGRDQVEVWSNGFGPAAQQILTRIRDERLAHVQEGTIKGGNVNHPVFDIFLAPCDFRDRREPCGSHSTFTVPDCGISVDAAGYTICCMGGAIDGILRLGARTKTLADLWDPEFAQRQTHTLCNHCGQHRGVDGPRIAQCAIHRGTLVSPTWKTAFERLEAQQAN